jgi:ferritin-like metal-binding protein YciE
MNPTVTPVKPKLTVKEGLRGLFVDELRDLYGAEKAMVSAIPEMIKNTTSPELVKLLTTHLETTKQHVTQVEKVFNLLGEKPEPKKCDGMNGLLKEAEMTMKQIEKGVVRDAGIIYAAQKLEHYEIAAYGTLACFATTLKEDAAATILHQNLVEEREADKKFTTLAKAHINMDAASKN